MRSLRRIVSFLPREDWIVVGWVMAIKVLLFSFGAKSYAVLWDNYITSPYQWFEIWDQWDFGSGPKIAEFGYSGADRLHSILSSVSMVSPSGCMRQQKLSRVGIYRLRYRFRCRSDPAAKTRSP